jgi:hypothetical protein
MTARLARTRLVQDGGQASQRMAIRATTMAHIDVNMDEVTRFACSPYRTLLIELVHDDASGTVAR